MYAKINTLLAAKGGCKCTSLFIHQAVSDGYRLAALPMSMLAATTNVENHKNEARFTFSQIHQYLQYGTYPRHFQMSDKQALRKRSKFFKSADGNLYYVGGCKLAVAICLLPQHLLLVLYFILNAARPKIGALVRERLVVEDPDQRKQIVASIQDTSHMGPNRTTDMVSNLHATVIFH